MRCEKCGLELGFAKLCPICNRQMAKRDATWNTMMACIIVGVTIPYVLELHPKWMLLTVGVGVGLGVLLLRSGIMGTAKRRRDKTSADDSPNSD